MAYKPKSPRTRSSRQRSSAPRRRSASGGGRRKRSKLRLWLEQSGWWARIMRAVVACFFLVGIALVYFASQLPDIRALDTIKKQQGITIEDAEGRVVANYGDVYGSYTPYEQLPKALIHAVIATEDRRFFEHHGIDFWGILRAMTVNLRKGKMVQGGSTVTQQVAKNVFLTPDRTLKRKLQEAMLALWLEARFSKKEIMAIYLNRVYLGGGAYGVDAASRRYFNKGATELNVYESALLAGLLKAPSRYNPATNSDRAQARAKQVLLNMVDAGFLKEKEVEPVMKSYASSPEHKVQGGDVRYYTDWIVDTLPNLVGQIDDDMIVTTTFDAKLQEAAQTVIREAIKAEGEKKRISQGAMVVMKPDGAVLAVVGGTDYAKTQYNRATQAKRQPGSSFKLFVYLAALEAGLTPMTKVEDAPIEIEINNKTWSPNNFESDGHRGEIPMVEAIRYSLNTVSVRLSQFTGVGRVADMAMRLGIPDVPAHPSIALGAVEATLMEMTTAYAHLPNGGKKVEAYGVTNIRTREGREIYKREKVVSDPVLAKGTVEMMNYMLNDAATRGTGASAAVRGYQSAGKTGTSQDYKDAWFIGYTAQLVTGVWVGNDDNKSMRKVTGGTVPAPIWNKFMVQAMKDLPSKGLPMSEGSSEGLLPWLFGGSESQPSQDEDSSDETPASLQRLPDRSAEDGRVVGEQIPEEKPFMAPGMNPGNGDGEVLSPEFWQKLEKSTAPAQAQ